MDNIDKAINDLNKRFGQGTIFQLGDDQFQQIERFPSGSIGLDDALGGGYPKGRMIEIYGEESSGKSTLCSHAIANVQKAGGTVAYVDGEHAFEAQYAKNIGINLETLYLSQPEYLEQALEIVDVLVKAGVDLIVFDSTSSMPPKAEMEGNFGDSHVGLAARIFSQACRKLNPTLKQTGSTIIWVSQTRQNISTFGWGDNTVVGVGKALKFYASARIQVKRTGSNKEQGESVSNKTKAIIKKNKTAPPFKEAEFDIVFGKGIDWQGELIDLAVEKDLVDKSGAWFKYIDKDGEILARGQGKTNFQQDLTDDHYEQLKKVLTLQNS